MQRLKRWFSTFDGRTLLGDLLKGTSFWNVDLHAGEYFKQCPWEQPIRRWEIRTGQRESMNWKAFAKRPPPSQRSFSLSGRKRLDLYTLTLADLWKQIAAGKAVSSWWEETQWRAAGSWGQDCLGPSGLIRWHSPAAVVNFLEDWKVANYLAWPSTRDLEDQAHTLRKLKCTTEHRAEWPCLSTYRVCHSLQKHFSGHYFIWDLKCFSEVLQLKVRTLTLRDQSAPITHTHRKSSHQL